MPGEGAPLSVAEQSVLKKKENGGEERTTRLRQSNPRIGGANTRLQPEGAGGRVNRLPGSRYELRQT